VYAAIIVVAVLILLYFTTLWRLNRHRPHLRVDTAQLRNAPWLPDGDFLWGSATSSHQVEGNCTNNNWYAFESAVAEDGRPRILNGQKAGLACDHWNRYEEDIRLMQALHLNAYRFSIEWSKVEPEPGKFDDKALDHYVQVVDALLAAGIAPMVTLHHFTDPLWFTAQGAFLQENAPETFARYVAQVVARLGNQVKFYCTVNEPSIYAMQGYLQAHFPPAVKDPRSAGIVFRNLLRAHTAAYRTIKKLQPAAQAGLAAALLIYDPPNRWNLPDAYLARAYNRSLNAVQLAYLVHGYFRFDIPGVPVLSYQDEASDAFDFFGLNYYSRSFKKFSLLNAGHAGDVTKAPPDKRTDMGWEIYPEGLYRCLKFISGYTSKPIYITENGIADDGDTKRAQFIEDHLLVMNRAMAEGMNIRGYFYWSLMDNFEWTFGFKKRFGLYRVDYTTQKRTLREGSRKYPKMILRGRPE
jgi:beta-glucosidase